MNCVINDDLQIARVDWFALAGPVERVLPRFVELARLGLDFVHVIPASTGVPRAVGVTSLMGLGQRLLPAVRAALTRAAS